MNDRFYERFFFNFFCIFFLLLSARASAAQIVHSVDVRVVHTPEMGELAQLAKQNDLFTITFAYDDSQMSRPPHWDEEKQEYSGFSHRFIDNATLINIAASNTNRGSLDFFKIYAFKKGIVLTNTKKEPQQNQSFRVRWTGKNKITNEKISVSIEFSDQLIKKGFDPINLKNQMITPLTNKKGNWASSIFSFQFGDDRIENWDGRIGGVFAE